MSAMPDPPAGESGDWFTATHWSIVRKASHDATQVARDALEKLCLIYWTPLYGYVRRKGHDEHEAQDLTQEFFTRLLARNVERLRRRYRDLVREEIAQTVTSTKELDEEMRYLLEVLT